MTYFDTGKEMISIGGQLVEADALRVVEALKDYDENLEVLCVNPDQAEINEAPFIICERVGDKLMRIFEAWELDDRVITRITMADGQKHNALKVAQDLEKDIRQKSKARYRDILDANHDLAASAIACKKSRFSFRDDKTGDIVTLYDDRPSERK